MLTAPVASMTIFPALEVTSSVEVWVVMLVSALAAATVMTAVSRAAAAAESIKRCLINSASYKCRRAAAPPVSALFCRKARSRTLGRASRAAPHRLPFAKHPAFGRSRGKTLLRRLCTRLSSRFNSNFRVQASLSGQIRLS